MTAAASELCKACGLCCNGVMFHLVRLQPTDIPQDLVALGLRIKRKKNGAHILQPCPAYQCSSCSIYPSRPERCRLFECQQLRRIALGQITQEAASEKIRDVQARVERIDSLLRASGKTDESRPLSKRYEKVIAVPLHSGLDENTVKLRQSLTREMEELDAILDADFRVAD